MRFEGILGNCTLLEKTGGLEKDIRNFNIT